MKRNLTVLIALLVAVAVATPAMAAVEFKWGGQFRVRWIASNNIVDGSDDTVNNSNFYKNANDHNNYIDQRLRLYLTVQSSENLKLNVKFEMGDIYWGRSGGRVGAGSGGGVGADGVNVELKNAYIDFAIPCTPTRAVIGIQGINLLNSWIVDDDFSAALLVTKLDNFKITLGYVAGQNDRDGFDLTNQQPIFNRESENVDDWTVAIDYACGPWSASLVWFYQMAHNTPASLHPATVNTPISGVYTATQANDINIPAFTFPTYDALLGDWFGRSLVAVRDNNMHDLGFNLTYKVDWLKAYVNFVKNFGSAKTMVDEDVFNALAFDEFTGDPIVLKPKTTKHDYTGWMVDAGLFYYCGPWTFNLQGFYTTGQKMKNQPVFAQALDVAQFKMIDTNGDFDWFNYPIGGPSKYFGSEILGSGILDGAEAGSYGNARFAGDYAAGTNFWRGYGAPTNLWTVSVGAAWQVLPKTKLALSYWYYNTSEDVMSKATIDANGRFAGQKFASDIGHEIDFNLTQGIVDGLNLDFVAAYLFAGDAYANSWNGQIDNAKNYSKDDVWKMGARLQWNF